MITGMLIKLEMLISPQFLRFGVRDNLNLATSINHQAGIVINNVFSSALNPAGMFEKSELLIKSASGINSTRQIEAARKERFFPGRVSVLPDNLRIAQMPDGTAESPITSVIHAR